MIMNLQRTAVATAITALLLVAGSALAQPDNATELMAEPNVDGLLVGGASLQAASFLDVIRAGAACYRS